MTSASGDIATFVDRRTVICVCHDAPPLLLPCLPKANVSPGFNSVRGLLRRQRREAQIWLDDSHLREQLPRLLTLDGRVDNHVIPWYPVNWCNYTVIVTDLEGVEDAQNFGGVASSAGRIRKYSTDNLLRVDDEHAADGEGNALVVEVGRILVVDPIRSSKLLAHIRRFHSHLVRRAA